LILGPFTFSVAIGIVKGSIMKFRSIAALPLLAMLAPVAGHAATAAEDAAKFGARQFVRSIAMSPQGDKVVIVSPRPDGGEAAVVVDMTTAASTPILGSDGGEDKILGCFFSCRST
jgi:hypothetical protein